MKIRVPGRESRIADREPYVFSSCARKPGQVVRSERLSWFIPIGRSRNHDIDRSFLGAPPPMTDPATPPVDRPFEAYEGDEPFIFVSYAHADMSEVYSDLVDLQEEFQGTVGSRCRIWYDTGIHPGEVFAARITEKIESCAQVVVFLSKNAARSRYIRNETNLALRAQKQLLPIFLDESRAGPGEVGEEEFWKWAKLELGSVDGLYKGHWPRSDYLGRIMRFISPATLVGEEMEDPPLADFRREVEAGLERTGWTDALAQELKTLATLLNLEPEVAQKVIDDTVKRLGGNTEFLALVDFFLSRGEFRSENWSTLQTKASALDLPRERWELLVQRRSATRAEELIQAGELEQAEGLLVSCVGEVLPQIPVRLPWISRPSPRRRRRRELSAPTGRSLPWATV
jgi:hypothetical protein